MVDVQTDVPVIASLFFLLLRSIPDDCLSVKMWWSPVQKSNSAKGSLDAQLEEGFLDSQRYLEEHYKKLVDFRRTSSFMNSSPCEQ